MGDMCAFTSHGLACLLLISETVPPPERDRRQELRREVGRLSFCDPVVPESKFYVKRVRELRWQRGPMTLQCHELCSCCFFVFFTVYLMHVRGFPLFAVVASFEEFQCNGGEGLNAATPVRTSLFSFCTSILWRGGKRYQLSSPLTNYGSK